MAMPSKAPSQRQLRVGEAIRHSLAEVLMRGELRDPELAGRSITVTEVKVSPDLKNATAFVMPLGGGDAGTVVAALGRAAPFLRAQVAKAIRLRHAPQIRFETDTSFEHAETIERLLHDPAVARDLADDADEPDEDEREDDERDGGGDTGADRG